MDAEHIGRDPVATERLAHLIADAVADAEDRARRKVRRVRDGNGGRYAEQRERERRDLSYRESVARSIDIERDRDRRDREQREAWPPLSRSQIARRRRKANRRHG